MNWKRSLSMRLFSYYRGFKLHDVLLWVVLFRGKASVTGGLQLEKTVRRKIAVERVIKLCLSRNGTRRVA